MRVLEVDEKGKVSLDRIDKPEAPAAQKRDQEKKDGPRPRHRTRRPGDNGGDRRPRRRHEG